jgi:WD40 repeat protein
VVKQFADGLALQSDWAGWWKQQAMLLPAQRMTDFFADVVLRDLPGNVVVFIDEIDWMIRLPFSDEFFAAIRSCFNRRATDPAFARLTFVLLGSAAPAQLIKDATRTPFNVGRGIELTDFTPREAAPLASWLGSGGEGLLERILYWTDGHPYLTQMLCAGVAERTPDGISPEQLVDSVVQEKLLSTSARQEENNLKFVADRLTQATSDLRGVLLVYRDVLREKPVKDIPASPIHTSLRLSGAAKPDAERRLRVRNRIYRRVFDETWVRRNMPASVPLRIAVAGTAFAAAIFALWYLFFFPRVYIDALETASNDVPYGAYGALNRPFHRGIANELLAQFWERRGDRSQAILVRARDGDWRGVASLVGADYPLLIRAMIHEGGVNSVAFSPDGKLVATASDDNMARVFEAAGGREVSRLAHQDTVYAVAFSPDAKLVATASGDKTARVFEAATGRELSRLAHRSRVFAVSFSPDSNRVATASWDNTARVFEAASGREVSQLAHQNTVHAVAFSPDGKLVVTGSEDKTARVFEAASGREVFRLAHQDTVYAVAFSPDSNRVATASGDKTARIFETASGRELSRLAHQDIVYAVVFSPNSKMIATGSEDKTARVFEAASEREVSRLTHQDSVYDVAFSPDNKLVATASRDKTARVFEAATGHEVSRLAHQGNVTAVAFSPGGKLVATASKDNRARLFEAAGGNGVSRPAHQGPVDAVAFSPDGKLLATGSRDNTARVFEAASGREVYCFAHQDYVRAVAFSPDGKLLATGSEDRIARVFEVDSGREVSRLVHQAAVVGVAFSPDGKRVATASGDNESRVFEAASGHEVSRLGHQASVVAVGFSPDGRLVATGLTDGTARVFEATSRRTASRREVSRLDYLAPVSAVAFSPDGNLFLTQTGNWLHWYRRDGERWRPFANRHLPVLWPQTARFVPLQDGCRACVEVVRDVPENLLKLERVSPTDGATPAAPADPRQLVSEWSAKLGLTFDPAGRIVPR